jgi:hypothetical protein
MTNVTGDAAMRSIEERAIAEKKRLALAYRTEAWDEAVAEGVDSDILAHAALFAALADLIGTYGEQAVAKLAEGLPRRIQAFEFSLSRSVQ